ncbi:MAG: TIGR03790 family protein [Chthoniobacterales bacterium]
MKRLLLAFLLLSLGQDLRAEPSASELAAATVVIYNRNAPGSAGLARFYAQARQIENDHLIGLACSTEEEISRQEYDQTIAKPLRKLFTERQWWKMSRTRQDDSEIRRSSVQFVALMRGMPLKIRGTADYPGDQAGSNVQSQNQASVDSELALLGFRTRQISGPATNPYFQSFRPFAELNVGQMLLVCRLDAPTVETVERMITDAVATEKSGLWGRAFVDGADHSSGGMAEGDAWLTKVVQDLRRVGIPVVFDQNPEVFPPGYPMSDCALYYGWYAGGATGPFADPQFKFRPGAVAVHIHSFSASTLRSAEANWVAPLLNHGAAASLGNVYEPYLQLTAHLDIFNDRLLHGFTFAESAYMSQRVLSWMNVAVGDPLYRPYVAWLRMDARDKEKKDAWHFYHDYRLKSASNDPGEDLAAARRSASRVGNGPMIEDLGLLEKEHGNFTSAVSYLQQAGSLYQKPEDLLRTVLEQADALVRSNNKKAALALLRRVEKLAPDAPGAFLLRQLEEKLEPRAPPPPASP